MSCHYPLGSYQWLDDFALIMKWIMKKAKLDNEVTPRDNDDDVIFVDTSS